MRIAYGRHNRCAMFKTWNSDDQCIGEHYHVSRKREHVRSIFTTNLRDKVNWMKTSDITPKSLNPQKLVNANSIDSLVKMQEMLFIYNAILDGWKVRRLEDGRFEFQKDRHLVTSDVCLDNYLREFVDYYLRDLAKESKN